MGKEANAFSAEPKGFVGFRVIEIPLGLFVKWSQTVRVGMEHESW